MNRDGKLGSVMVVGGGIAGMQSAIDLAESGFKVHLVEKSPAIGGRMAQLDKTFPTNDCAMCTLAPRMVDAGRHINIERLTYSEVTEVSGEAGHFRVTVRKKARSVDMSKCTGCEECTLHCPVRNRAFTSTPESPEPEVSAEDRDTLDGIVRQHRHKPAPLIPILQGINAAYNYLPAPALDYVSRDLGTPLAHILRVATFYSMFSLNPRGKHVVTVCQGTSCFVRGAERLVERLGEELGVQLNGVTEDGKFSLETVRCIGCCALAPVLKLDEDVHANVRPRDVSPILAGY
jgi:NADH:ubiquinone oxidoreductase subunit E